MTSLNISVTAGHCKRGNPASLVLQGGSPALPALAFPALALMALALMGSALMSCDMTVPLTFL